MQADKPKKRGGRVKHVSYAELLEKANNIFFDRDKTISWWMSPCPMLDNMSPFECAKSGQSERVLNLLEFFN